jgi:hypothetical protein
MQTETSTFLMIGLPEAGKTSFLLALDEMLQEPPTTEALRGYGLAADRSYLERFKSVYRRGEKLKKTERKLQGAPTELWFEEPSSGKRGKLFLPDVDGELFQDQWADRQWELSYKDSLRNISGILLFVRADLQASNQEMLGELAALMPEESAKVPFNPKKASAQVQLVEVLQFIACSDLELPRLRVAVIVSAWDTVLKPNNLQPKHPARFLEREWPLIDQYLRTNPEHFQFEIYGVSALGGNEEELKVLSDLPPQQRVAIVHGDDQSRDLTLPLKWLMAVPGEVEDAS